MYAKLNKTKDTVTKYPYTIGDLREDNPTVSIPQTLTADMVEYFQMIDVVEEEIPTYDPLTETVRELPISLVKGTSTNPTEALLKYTVEKLTDEEVAANIRAHRNSQFHSNDYMGLSDVVMTDEWKVYRQALRDVPQQKGFPQKVTWPVILEGTQQQVQQTEEIHNGD